MKTTLKVVGGLLILAVGYVVANAAAYRWVMSRVTEVQE